MSEMESDSKSTTMNRALLLINTLLLSIGNCAGPLLMRLYYLHGGKRIWFSSWLLTAGFPVIFIPIYISYINRRRTQQTTLFLIKPPLIAAFTIVGVLTGVDNYLYAYGVAKLPVSTSSLIIAGQLAFTAVFAFLLVRQKFTSYSVNSVCLLTIGAAVLALHTDSDRPKGESNKEYVIGFVLTVVAAVLYGFILPLIELVYRKTKQEISYALVLEIQTVMCLSSTVFCTVGMIVNNDFKVIGREAREFGLGESKYYGLVVATGIIWQCFFVGAVGVIYCSSSLLSGIVISVTLPITEVLAVIFYKEKFTSEKGVSLVLSLWGFVSYFYGEIKLERKMKKRLMEQKSASPPQTEMPPIA